MAEAAALYKAAFGAFTRGELDAAIEGFDKVIEADADFALAYQGQAEVYARLERLDEAIATIRKAIELEPDESLYHTSLSRFLQRQGKIPEAEAAAADAVRLQTR
jgi:tetratricopeptide (TPR) repeat protein